MAELGKTNKKQVSLGEAIENLRNNFKKEPIRRLTAERLREFAVKLHDNIEKFIVNHNELIDNERELLNNSYFVNNYFQNIELLYTSCKSEYSIKSKQLNIAYPKLNPLTIIKKSNECEPSTSEQNKKQITEENSNENNSDEEDNEVVEPFEKLNVTMRSNSTPIKQKEKYSEQTLVIVNSFFTNVELFEDELEKAENYVIRGFHIRAVIARSFLTKTFDQLYINYMKNH